MRLPKFQNSISFELAAGACAAAFGAGALCMYFFDGNHGPRRRAEIGERLNTVVDSAVGLIRGESDQIARDEQAMNLCAIDGDSHTTDVLLDKLDIPKAAEGMAPPPLARP